MTRETNDKFFTELREKKEGKMVKSETFIAEKEDYTQNTEFKFAEEEGAEENPKNEEI